MAASSGSDWRLFDLRLRCGEGELRPVREPDVEGLAAMLPDDYEHDPHAETLPGEGGVDEHRRRLVLREYWRSMGAWSPASWSLGFVIERAGVAVGLQSLEADDFAVLGTVDSGSWLAHHARGHGLATSMRTAVLALAFDHYGARAAVSSARCDNAASLAVSRRIGYVDNGTSLNASGSGVVRPTHLRLTADHRAASGLGRSVRSEGVPEALPFFGA